MDNLLLDFSDVQIQPKVGCAPTAAIGQSQLFDPSSLGISSANRFWQSFEPS